LIVVLDSGIWISTLHFGGTPLAALDRAFVFDRIVVCNPIHLEPHVDHAPRLTFSAHGRMIIETSMERL
jgi:hypothetical protein